MSRGWWAGAVAAIAVGAGLALDHAREPAAPTHEEQLATLSGSIDFFERRLAADPINTLAADHLADRLVLRFQLGAEITDLRRAEEVSRALVQIARDPAEAHARLARILLMEHEFAKAMETAERALAYDELHQDALASYFDVSMAVGRYEQARAALDQMTSGSLPRKVRASHWLAFQGQTDGAVASLQRVCGELERGAYRTQMVAWCLTELAALEAERGDGRAARSLLRRALRVQPGYRGAVEALADEAHAEGDWEKAVQLYEQIRSDAHPDIYLRVAEAHASLGDSASAARAREAFLRVADTPAGEALNAHPLALLLADNPATQDRALAVALRDVARRPSVESYDVLSWVRFRRGEVREALAASDRARAHGSSSPTMDYHRAKILRAAGRVREAELLLRQATADPTLLEPHARADLAGSKL